MNINVTLVFILMLYASKMKIEVSKITTISNEVNLTFKEDVDWYEYRINKTDHGFYVKILKSGQYIFISALIDDKEFPIEHIEFYMKESEDEVLKEIREILDRLKGNKSRILTQSKRSGIRAKAEILESDGWVGFGYQGKEVRRNQAYNKSYKQ